MSSKLRLNDLPLSDDELDISNTSEFMDNARPRKKPKSRTEKRQAIEDYMEARSLKRNISECYDYIR